MPVMVATGMEVTATLAAVAAIVVEAHAHRATQVPPATTLATTATGLELAASMTAVATTVMGA